MPKENPSHNTEQAQSRGRATSIIPEIKKSNSERTGANIESAVRAEISLPAEPIQIKVDSPTDYVAAVLTPIVVAISAVLIAWLNQKNAIRSTEALQKLQLRSATANFRQTWSTDFRTFCADYVGSVTQLHLKKMDNADFLESADANELHTSKTTSRASIRMMLDKNKPYTTEILAIMDDVEDALFDAHPSNPKSPLPYLSKFVDKAQEVREVAWNDIKRDLHHT
jgi:hypothetical protein